MCREAVKRTANPIQCNRSEITAADGGVLEEGCSEKSVVSVLGLMMVGSAIWTTAMCQTSAIPRPTQSSLKSGKTNALYLHGDTPFAIGIQTVTLPGLLGGQTMTFLAQQLRHWVPKASDSLSAFG